MKKLTLLILLITSTVKAQTFDFTCEPFTVSSELELVLRTITANFTPIDSGPIDNQISYRDAGRLTAINAASLFQDYAWPSSVDLSIFRNLQGINIQGYSNITEVILPDHGKEFYDFRLYSNNIQELDISNVVLRENKFGITGNYNLNCIKVKDIFQVLLMGLPDRVENGIYVGKREINILPYRYQITNSGKGSQDFMIQTTDCE